MGCQKDIVEKIRKQEGDDLLAVKGINTPELKNFVTEEKSNGRQEIRLNIVSDIPDELVDYTFAWKDQKNA